MAGDHKCPVCQATFTRPQHVARHMRSHTGDRPYKCQHCGDQFARSDLLSRHVNKCHPNEKPLVSVPPSRRKGTSSASRATTSKQACDQCVQSTLPCDGANPCSKCVHRKTRCTYVKFHRQTAPMGPGHPARLPHDASNPAHPSLGALPPAPNQYRLSDPFFLPGTGSALNPSAISQSNASGPTLYADHQFTFPPPLQASAPSYDNAFDYAARYRAQADLLSRTGVIPQERAPPIPAIYQDSHAPQDPNNVARYPQPYHLRNDPQDYPVPPSPNGVDYGYSIDNKSGPYPSNVLAYSTNGYNHPPLTYNHDTQSHQRCESSASDTGSSAGRSQPSSATSSSVHLPLAGEYPHHSYSRPTTADGVVQDREGFSSAFGLMSLDDSEVLAGFGEGAPFFDNTITHSGSSHNPSWGDGPTPRANPADAPPANGKKGTPQQQQQQAGTPASLKELKEIWKQYMRTPPTGQPLTHEHHLAGSPKRERGLSRVASLPSVKTPSATTGGSVDPMRSMNGIQPQQPQQQQQQQQQQANGANNMQYGGHTSHSRGHNHTDDLRSYEQAILARRAPLTLHLAPRRRGNTTSTGPPPTNSTNAPPQPAAAAGKGNRASPAGSGSGSDRSMSVFTDDRASSTRASPTSSGGSHGHGVDDTSRPTFKRLPSQTLGPEYAKRPATSNMLSGARNVFPGVVNEQEMQQRGPGIAERTRRMSFPSGRTGLVGLQD